MGLAVLLLAVAVLAGTLVTRSAGRTVTLDPPAAPAARVVTPAGVVDFTGSNGSGRLRIVHRSWSSEGTRPPGSGSYLHLEVELSCSAGVLDYHPYGFLALDRTGRVFEVEVAGALGPVLDTGTLGPGDSIRGSIGFDLPRGDTTLLLTDGANRTVAVVEVPLRS